MFTFEINVLLAVTLSVFVMAAYRMITAEGPREAGYYLNKYVKEIDSNPNMEPDWIVNRRKRMMIENEKLKLRAERRERKKQRQPVPFI